MNVQSLVQPVQMDWLQWIDPPRGQSAAHPQPRHRRCRNENQNDLFLELWLGVSEDYVPEWSDQDILALQEGVLLDAVKTVLWPREAESWKETKDWIADDRIHPFAFRVCCAAIPVDDPDELRETLVEYAGLTRQERTTSDLKTLEDSDDV